MEVGFVVEMLHDWQGGHYRYYSDYESTEFLFLLFATKPPSGLLKMTWWGASGFVEGVFERDVGWDTRQNGWGTGLVGCHEGEIEGTRWGSDVMFKERV